MNSPFVQSVYKKSIFSDSLKIKKILSNFSKKTFKKLQKDELYSLLTTITGHYAKNVEPTYLKLSQEILKTQKAYMAAILEMKQGESG